MKNSCQILCLSDLREFTSIDGALVREYTKQLQIGRYILSNTSITWPNRIKKYKQRVEFRIDIYSSNTTKLIFLDFSEVFLHFKGVIYYFMDKNFCALVGYLVHHHKQYHHLFQYYQERYRVILRIPFPSYLISKVKRNKEWSNQHVLFVIYYLWFCDLFYDFMD